MSLDWDRIVAIALALPATELTTHYRARAVKTNGRPMISPSGEPGSFVLHIDQDEKAMLIDTDPDTYWQTPHYEGWPALLVRYDSPDPRRVGEMIARSHAWCTGLKPPNPRKR